MSIHSELTFLRVNIGRGHPFYLDGIVEAIITYRIGHIMVNMTDVRQWNYRGAKLMWTLLDWLYRHGSSRSPVGWLYSLIRRHETVGRRFMDSFMKRVYREYPFETLMESVVVSHPILVGILSDNCKVIYQHGELVAPGGSLVAGAHKVIVPTDHVMDLFAKAGYSREQVFVSGLCIEPGAVSVAEEAYRKRMSRQEQKIPLTGLFVSSGAEPRQHIKAIISSIVSCRRIGIRTLVLARERGRLDCAVRQLGRKSGLNVTTLFNPGAGHPDIGDCAIVLCRDTREESEAMSFLTPQIDFFVGPSHERTGWALGLGLPMFVLTPCFGPFAPLNLLLLERSGTGVAINSLREASALGGTVIKLRESGQLARMSERGWGKYRIDGFEQIARFLAGAN